jgi:ElaB/YqjD/DUF883 family membrane-anchored ribosome-binding protein
MAGTGNAKHPSHHSQTDSSAADELKDKASEIGHNIRELGGKLGDAAQEQYVGFRDRAAGYFENGRERVRKVEEGVESYIQEKPVQALLMAAGVGMLLGWLWRRRR